MVKINILLKHWFATFLCFLETWNPTFLPGDWVYSAHQNHTKSNIFAAACCHFNFSFVFFAVITPHSVQYTVGTGIGCYLNPVLLNHLQQHLPKATHCNNVWAIYKLTTWFTGTKPNPPTKIHYGCSMPCREICHKLCVLHKAQTGTKCIIPPLIILLFALL